MSENVKQLAIRHNKRGNLEAIGGGQLRPRMTRKVYLSYPVYAIVFRSSLKGEKRRLGDNDSQRKKIIRTAKTSIYSPSITIKEYVEHINKFTSATFFAVTIRSILPYPAGSMTPRSLLLL